MTRAMKAANLIHKLFVRYNKGIDKVDYFEMIDALRDMNR